MKLEMLQVVQLGVEVLLESQSEEIKGKRIGLVSNYTMTDRRFRPVIDLLADSDDWKVTKLFGPEHGVMNSAKEGEHVSTSTDPHTGLPAYSLYGKSRKPSPEMLDGIEVLVIDLQDIGSRYYTNMNTVYYCMEACGEAGLPCVILDRPNPIDGISREGNILEDRFRSFVGMHPIPNRHGLTMGELAHYFNDCLGGSCDLTVIEAKGWHREMLLTDTRLPFVASSPNTAHLDMCLLYPGTCFFEGTNISVGRGTAFPFQAIGSPYIEGHRLARWFNDQHFPGVLARPLYFVPTYNLYSGELCQGIHLNVTDAKELEPVRTGVSLLQGIAHMYEKDFQFRDEHRERPFIDLLAGTDQLRSLIRSGKGESYVDDSKEDLEKFSREMKKYEIYQ